jgi:cold-inducible RNA-binding protein
MSTKLFVGSLPYSTTGQQLEQLFAQYGQVASATVISDKFSGRSKGFGFVEMATEEEAQAALALNGYELDGRAIIVNEARPQEPRTGGFGGGSRGGDRGGSRGGFGGGSRGGDRGGSRGGSRY